MMVIENVSQKVVYAGTLTSLNNKIIIIVMNNFIQQIIDNNTDQWYIFHAFIFQFYNTIVSLTN